MITQKQTALLKFEGGASSVAAFRQDLQAEMFKTRLALLKRGQSLADVLFVIDRGILGHLVSPGVGHPVSPDVGHPMSPGVGHPVSPGVGHPVSLDVGHLSNQQSVAPFLQRGLAPKFYLEGKRHGANAYESHARTHSPFAFW